MFGGCRERSTPRFNRVHFLWTLFRHIARLHHSNLSNSSTGRKLLGLTSDTLLHICIGFYVFFFFLWTFRYSGFGPSYFSDFRFWTNRSFSARLLPPLRTLCTHRPRVDNNIYYYISAPRPAGIPRGHDTKRIARIQFLRRVPTPGARARSEHRPDPTKQKKKASAQAAAAEKTQAVFHVPEHLPVWRPPRRPVPET